MKSLILLTWSNGEQLGPVFLLLGVDLIPSLFKILCNALLSGLNANRSKKSNRNGNT